MDLDLRAWAHRDPDRIALVMGVNGEESVTYGQLEAQANRLAHVFRRAGLKRGDRVAGLASTGPLPFVMAWAAYRAGLYFTPLPTTQAPPELAYLVDNSEARIVIADHVTRATAESLPGAMATSAAAVRWLSHGGPLEGFTAIEDAMSAESSSPIDDETPGALMFYTSGTTGRPKGVVRPLLPATHRGPPPFAGDLVPLFGLGEETQYLSTAPLYHAAALRFGLSITAAGGTVHVLGRFDAETALKAIDARGITHSQWVPTMLQRMLQLPEAIRRAYRGTTHRMAIHAAAPCPQPVKEAMIDWWGPILVEYYAGSESVGMTMITSTEWLARKGSVGRAIRGELHVLGEDDRELPAGEAGRVFFSGVSPFEYFHDADKTRARTSSTGFQTLGDVGYVDGDGYLFLTDRADDMIISGGVNIYPQEVERVIFEMPEVIDVGVVGAPDADFGERVVVFVVPRADLAGDANAATVKSAVLAHCAANLGKLKQPRELHVVRELPHSATGKLLRRELRKRLEAGAVDASYGSRPPARTLLSSIP